MSIKKANYFIGRETFKSAKIFTLIILLLTAFFFTISLIFSDSEGTVTNGLDMSIIIYSFILGLTAYSSYVKMLFQNGISRKTTWLSITSVFIMLSIAFSVIFVLLFEILTVLFGLYSNIIFTSFSADLVGRFFPNMNYILGVLLKILITFVCLLFAGEIGFATGTLFKILNKKWKIIIFAGVPALLLVVFPIFFAFMGNHLYSRFFIGLMHFLFGVKFSIARSLISLSILSLIFMFLSRLLMSKVQIDD